MKVIDIEPVHLSRPTIDTECGDGTKDTLLIVIHTDEGITGSGEVDSSPLVAKAIVNAPASRSIAAGLRNLMVGEDPLDIALSDIADKVAGRSVTSLFGGVYRYRIKAYASAIMPETPK